MSSAGRRKNRSAYYTSEIPLKYFCVNTWPPSQQCPHRHTTPKDEAEANYNLCSVTHAKPTTRNHAASPYAHIQHRQHQHAQRPKNKRIADDYNYNVTIRTHATTAASDTWPRLQRHPHRHIQLPLSTSPNEVPLSPHLPLCSKGPTLSSPTIGSREKRLAEGSLNYS